MPFLTQENTNWKFIAIVAVLAVIVVAGILAYLRMTEEEFVDIPEKDVEEESADTWPPPSVVKEPGEAGQWVIVDELVILASGQDIEALIAGFNGEITLHAPQTGSYQVRFPVSSLEELDVIADELRKKESGIQVMRVIVMPPPIF